MINTKMWLCLFAFWSAGAECLASSSSYVTVEVYASKRVFSEESGQVVVQQEYELQSTYKTSDKAEMILLCGIAEINTYSKPNAIHPWVGGPLYLAVVRDGRQVGRTILFYSGANVGFYLLDNIVRGDSGLDGKLDYDHVYPISSEPICKYFQDVVRAQETEKGVASGAAREIREEETREGDTRGGGTPEGVRVSR